MKIAVGGFAQESHSFSPVPGSWGHFGPQEIVRGPAIFTKYAGTKAEMGGVLDTARHHEDVELIPTLYAEATASAGHMQGDVFTTILDELVASIRQAGPIDGVLLVLHGAMIADGYDDATGEVLRVLRAAIGPDLPLIGTLDLHANVTEQMVRQTTALIGYHTAPHVDMYETAQRALTLLIKTIAGEVQPVAALRRIPMILPGETARTTDGPYAEVVDMAKAWMQQPGILDASVFSVQPWLDVYDVGCTTLVITDGNLALAEQTAARLADEFWARRRDFALELTLVAAAIQRALVSEIYPFILADSADAPTSGAPGDSTVVLQALLAAQPQKDCLHNIVDSAVVAQMMAAGVGQEITVTIGATLAPAFYQPVTVTGRVKLLADGDFVQKGPGFHGAVVSRGFTGVLVIGHIYLVVMERPCRQWDPELYRSVGLEPRDAQIVVVKSPAAFRAAYGPFAAEILIVDVTGVASPNLRALPFKQVRRPLYPLDEI
ncbi:MAG: M81 family metallopeptidase [Chloroflexi bacterium]|nr:M81 family metallopeptidase [Chloroflexota bacterium]